MAGAVTEAKALLTHQILVELMVETAVVVGMEKLAVMEDMVGQEEPDTVLTVLLAMVVMVVQVGTGLEGQAAWVVVVVQEVCRKIREAAEEKAEKAVRESNSLMAHSLHSQLF